MEVTQLKNEEEFRETIGKFPITIVDFYSTECPPCEKLAPVYSRLAEEYPDVRFTKIFRQENRPLAASLEVSGSPTLLFFCHGKVQDKRLTGEIDERELRATIDDLIAKEDETYRKVERMESNEERDLVIIGSGPAGLTAAVYAARYGIDQVLIGQLPGGLMTSSHKICNYPSETEITGMELTQKMADHVTALEVPQLFETVTSIKQDGERFVVSMTGGKTIGAKAVLLATGTKHKHLGLPDEGRLTGKGVSYCATCDAMFYRGKVVAVAGGSDAANTASLYLAEIAEKVYQIYRGTELRGETAWIEQIKKNPKIEVLFESSITKLLGENRLEGVQLDKPFAGSEVLKLDGLFVEIGSDPDMTLIAQMGLRTDEKGYVETAPDQTTSIPGAWAAGDITTNSDNFRQIITACSEGAIAAQSVFKYLQKTK